MSDKKSLGVVDVESQLMLELPDRELMSLVRVSNFSELLSVENIFNRNHIRIISVDNNKLTLTVNVSCVAVNALLVNKPHTCTN